jgi:hypothetical protein
MPRSLILQAGVEAARWARERELREVHALVVGQVLFGLGWSLMWATALSLITFIPIMTGPMLMAAGLGVPAVQRWRRRDAAALHAGLKPPVAARAADTPS